MRLQSPTVSSTLKVTGSNVVSAPNFTGIGGTNVILSGEYVAISGGGGGGGGVSSLNGLTAAVGVTGTGGSIIINNGQNIIVSGEIKTISFALDGGGSVLTTGQKKYARIPWNATINNWYLVGDVTGSIVIDIWKNTYANYPPVAADTIVGAGVFPNLSNQIKNTSDILTGWATNITGGNFLGFQVNSVSGVKWVSLQMELMLT